MLQKSVYVLHHGHVFLPQGSDGFPGVQGPAGEKGKKVCRNLKLAMILCRVIDFYINALLLFCINQGPAGQPGGGGQRGPNVSGCQNFVIQSKQDCKM